jgi:hypothetical protein
LQKVHWPLRSDQSEHEAFSATSAGHAKSQLLPQQTTSLAHRTQTPSGLWHAADLSPGRPPSLTPLLDATLPGEVGTVLETVAPPDTVTVPEPVTVVPPVTLTSLDSVRVLPLDTRIVVADELDPACPPDVVAPAPVVTPTLEPSRACSVVT